MDEVQQQMDAFEGALSELMKKYGVKSLVADVQFEDSNIGVWLPGCKSDCPTSDQCYATNFLRASRMLQHHVMEFLKQEADDIIEG